MAETATRANEAGYRVEAGYVFPPTTLVVSTEEQRAKHDFTAIPEKLYGGIADVGFLARYPIKVMGHALFACHPERGYVHTVQRIRQRVRIALDEPIDVTGRFVDVVDHPRGWMMHSRFEYRRQGESEPVLVVEPDALMADPTRMEGPAAKPGGKTTGAGTATEDAGWEQIGTKPFTPEMVLGYSGDTDNKIHTDPEYARGFGFRAPIAAGNQIVHVLLEAIARDEGVPEQLDVTIRFRRPVFWDETLVLEGQRAPDGRLLAVRALRDGKVAADLERNVNTR